MTTSMKEKFEKYWDCYSVILSLAVVLDPRYKLNFVEYCFTKLDEESAQEKVTSVRNKLYHLFKEYMRIMPSAHESSSLLGCALVGCDDDEDEDDMDDFDVFQSQGLGRNKSQLDIYLEKALADRKTNAKLDVLNFWKMSRVRFPELSVMARDILSIPITSVASESAFSTGGQIINKYRSSILPKNVEALHKIGYVTMKDTHSDEEEEELVDDFGTLVDNISNLRG